MDGKNKTLLERERKGVAERGEERAIDNNDMASLKIRLKGSGCVLIRLLPLQVPVQEGPT